MTTIQVQAEVLRLADMVRRRLDPKIVRYVEAYLMMALPAKYRPGAPSDGCGNIQLSKVQCDDVNRLLRESVEYAVDFDKEEDTDTFNIGCSNFSTNRAFVFSIEAARLLASGHDGNAYALRVLQMAIEDIRDAERQRKAKAA